MNRFHSTRRGLLARAAGTLAGSALVLSGPVLSGNGARGSARPARARTVGDDEPQPPGEPGVDYRPVVTPDGSTLPWRLVEGVKVFHLIAEEVEHEFAPGLAARCWGYNGQVHGPTIEALEGDRIRLYVTNRLPAPTTVHLHGMLLSSGMDGVGGLSQRAILPGETFRYELTLRQHGTLMYHSHHDEMTQMALGLMGLVVVHPRRPSEPPPDRDYAFLLSEWRIEPGQRRPDPSAMADFNVLTMNARAFPGTTPIVAAKGERVRLRFGNLSAMDHHPIHLHGHAFEVTETDGGPIPAGARWPETTVLVPVGATRTIEFAAEEGDWAMHCHMTHHIMNQMGHDLANMVGVRAGELDERLRRLVPGAMLMGADGMHAMGEMGMAVPPNSLPMVGAEGPHGYITMGGMFTILKVRERVDEHTAASWYEAPEGTVASPASAAELERDGVAVPPPRSDGGQGSEGHGSDAGDGHGGGERDAGGHGHGRTGAGGPR